MTFVFMDDAANGLEPNMAPGASSEECKRYVQSALSNSAKEFEIAFDINTNAPLRIYSSMLPTVSLVGAPSRPKHILRRYAGPHGLKP